jgi:signal transduction histidine kinase
VAVAEIVAAIERMVRRVAEASIRLEVRLGLDAGDVIADGHQIEQVLLKLAINACDAMDNRGTLSLEIDADAPDSVARALADNCRVFWLSCPRYSR